MNKIILFIITGWAFAKCSHEKSTHVRNDLFFDNVRGTVEQIREITYNVDSFGNIGHADSCCVRVLAYDNQGYRTLDVTQDMWGKGRVGQVYSKRYDNGKPNEIQFMANGEIVSILVATLNKHGNYDTSWNYDQTGKPLSFYTAVEVNEYGKIISMKRFTVDGTLEQIVVNNYQQQIWVGGFIRDNSGQVMTSTIIKPNQNLDPAEVVQTQQINGKPSVTRTTFVYERFDEHGNWVQRRDLDETGKVRKLVKREIRYGKR